ncbi:DUF1102 domain-containing protein [Halorientalis halophila]|uniref:DUF1102 domain-containing protein n=1 Tax=Halorientalis halophila TaxID=3108499 RepID=UPI003008BEA1
MATLGLAVVVAAVTATGAFTAITADRAAAVEVVNDDQQVLGLAPSDGPNGAYATVDANGVLSLDIAGDTGVGTEARTRIDDVFTVTNQGTQTVGVWLEDGVEEVVFYAPDSDGGDGTAITGFGSFQPLDAGPEGAVALAPGESVTVGIGIDTRGVDVGTTLLETVRINANAIVGDGGDAPVEAAQFDRENSSLLVNGTAFVNSDGALYSKTADAYLRDSYVALPASAVPKAYYTDYAAFQPGETWFPDTLFDSDAFAADDLVYVPGETVAADGVVLGDAEATVMANGVVVTPATAFPDSTFFPDSIFFPDSAFFPDSTFFPGADWNVDETAFPDANFFPGDSFVTDPDNMEPTDRQLMENGFLNAEAVGDD